MTAPSAILTGIGLFTNLIGTASSVSSYNSAGNAGLTAAAYNSKLIDLNLSRELDSIASELKTFTSTQKAQIAASGVSVNSKSSLVIMNEALTKFEKEAVVAKENARLQKAQELFSARQQQEVLRQQALSTGLSGLANTALSAVSLFSILGADSG